MKAVRCAMWRGFKLWLWWSGGGVPTLWWCGRGEKILSYLGKLAILGIF